jgi:iron(III) transport system substrate-binding protein
MKRLVFLQVLAVCSVSLLAGCPNKQGKDTVTVYCSLDQIHAERLLKLFERESGIKVRPKWDTEASKTTGLVNTLIAEASNPRCDVFWNNEVSQTVVLAERGILESYKSLEASTIPREFKDEQGRWTGFAARARIFIVNRKLVPKSDWPQRLEDLFNEKYKGQIAVAKPFFGTTATHSAALFATMGEARARDFFNKLKSNGVVLCAGNAQLKDRVVAGEFAYGLTDTDDFNLARLAGADVEAIFPDQEKGQRGALLIPNSVSLIKGAKHKAAAKKLIDFLLSPRVEALLAKGRSAQIPVRAGIVRPDWIPTDLRWMSLEWSSVGKAFKPSQKFLQTEFIK